MITHFVVKQDFWSNDTQSHYMQGLHYIVGENLSLLVALWVEQGLIEICKTPPAVARMKGH